MTMPTQIDPYKALALGTRVKLNTDAPFTPTYIQASLTRSGDPQGIYTNRVKNKHIILENPARASSAQKERDSKKARRESEKKKRKTGALGRRSTYAKGLWKLENGAEKFDLFLPLHQLWMGYMSELLGLSPPSSVPATKAMPSSSSMHAKLVKADFHGSLLTVCQSKNPCLVGLSGIVIHETENAFKVITRKDQLKLIPKQNSIFTLAVPLYSTLPQTQFEPAEAVSSALSGQCSATVLDAPHIAFDLYGNQFGFRSADRAGRKFKAKETIEL
ncbi:RNase P subunit p29-like protein [Suillus paluster]|uniref:RNase P subunit p29-like protein n=1 Tax=Suillus paluster TaxID=48578 RepID=UPI001B867A9B|nr:RNase P subunit p29-like protein [Suillus paluster]KAG1735342.1 RNase P subunit p29-like protein [Suillus paluster]